MLNGKTVTCLVPAKRHSYRLRDKNILSCHHRPLVCYPLLLQKECGFFDDWILSTDSTEIKDVVRRYGFTEAYTRPPELATTESDVWDAVRHAMRHLKKHKTDIIVLLHATSPCLRSPTITEAVKLFTSQTKFDAMVSVHEVSPYTFYDGQEHYKEFDNVVPAGKHYALNNAIHIAGWDYLLKNRFYKGAWTFFEIPKDEAIDIDTETDLKIAESILHWRQHYESPEDSKPVTKDL